MSDARESRSAGDLAGQDFWQNVWEDSLLPQGVRTDGSSVRDSAFIESLRRSLSMAQNVDRVIELGCAGSVWLSLLATHFGLSVAGLDYSERGCELSRAVLARDGVVGDVRCADIFSAPDDFAGAFDAAVSFGVVEHFENTADVIRAAAAFVRPGGLVITEVPNLTGLAGAMLKRANRPVYDAHHALGRGDLSAAHGAAGLEVLSCEYVMSIGPSVVSLHTADGYSVGAGWRRAVSLLHRVSDIVWRLERRMGRRFPGSRVLSPFIWCVARVPQGSAAAE